MKIAAISDVHVKAPFDEADVLLCSFLDHPDVRGSDYICLLGDIFDLMNGNHPQYLEDYHHIWEKMDELMRSGKTVLYFEGNHDIHLEELFRKRWKEGNFIPFQYPIIENLDGKTYYFSHGDEHEVDNQSYQRYKRLLLTKPLKFASNRLMPYALLNFIGKRASNASRKKGYKKFDEQLVKGRFRDGVRVTTEGRFNFILGGHSHVQDEFQINDHSVYLNNGYALRTRTFILIENHVPKFISLSV